MKRSAITGVLALVAIGTLELLKKVELQEPFKGMVAAFTEHLLLAAIAVLTGSILIYVAGQALEEYLMPVVSAGFATLAAAIATKVGDIPGALRQGLEEALSKLTNSMQPELADLAKAGKISEAMDKIQTQQKDEPAKQREEITILLHSEKEADWIRASEIMKANKDAQDPQFYLTLAYRFWSIGEIDKAINLGEHGLRLAKTDKEINPALVSKFHNSLAYYYADGNKTEKERLAREYALAAYGERKKFDDSSVPTDTFGYVLITFGNRSEIQQGVSLCHKAMAKGTPFKFFVKHVTRANNRLENLKT